jgi:hypothetical protein
VFTDGCRRVCRPQNVGSFCQVFTLRNCPWSLMALRLLQCHHADCRRTATVARRARGGVTGASTCWTSHASLARRFITRTDWRGDSLDIERWTATPRAYSSQEKPRNFIPSFTLHDRASIPLWVRLSCRLHSLVSTVSRRWHTPALVKISSHAGFYKYRLIELLADRSLSSSNFIGRTRR